jgi:hypothetical protein
VDPSHLRDHLLAYLHKVPPVVNAMVYCCIHQRSGVLPGDNEERTWTTLRFPGSPGMVSGGPKSARTWPSSPRPRQTKGAAGCDPALKAATERARQFFGGNSRSGAGIHHSYGPAREPLELRCFNNLVYSDIQQAVRRCA